MTTLKLNFNEGVIGAIIEHTSDDTRFLYYTQYIPEHKVTLCINIWGGTTLSFELGFLFGGQNWGIKCTEPSHCNKYKYTFKKVSKDGWDETSEIFNAVSWFDSLVIDAILNFQKSETNIVEGSAANFKSDGDLDLTIKIKKEKLEEILPLLVNNFLDYKENTIKTYTGRIVDYGLYEYKNMKKTADKTLSLKHKNQNEIAKRLSLNTGKQVNLGGKQLKELEEYYDINDDDVFYELYKENKFRFKIKNKEDDIVLDEETTIDEMANKIKELEEGQRAIFSLHNSIIRESGDLFDDYAYNFIGVLIDNVTLDLVEGFEINVYANSIEEGEKKAEKIINENPEWKDKVIIEFQQRSKDEGSGQSIEVEDEIIQSIISGIRSDIRDYSTRNYSKLPIGVYANGGGVDDDQISSIIQKLKDKGYSDGDNLGLTEKFNGKEIKLNFYYSTVGDWELEIFAPLTIIEILSKYLTFDKVSQGYTSINVDLLFYYKGNRVCTMMGSWDDEQEEMKTFIKINNIESSYFNSYPIDTMGGFDEIQFEKNIKNAIDEINSKKTLSLKHKKQNEIAKRLSLNTGKEVDLGEKQLGELEEEYDLDNDDVFYELYKENEFPFKIVKYEDNEAFPLDMEMTIDEMINRIRELKENEVAYFSEGQGIGFNMAFPTPPFSDDLFNYDDVLKLIISELRSDIRDSHMNYAVISNTLPNVVYKDGGEIWKLTKEEYAKETITVHSGDNLKRKKTDLERYFEENVTNVIHANAVKRAIKEGKYEEAIKNGTMTREKANEIMKLANGGEVGEFDIKNILDKTSLSQGTKDILENDFIESGYSNIFSLIAETPEKLPIKLKIWATSKNIQEKINGFKSGKNTYLQANMIAEVMHSIDISEIPKEEVEEIEDTPAAEVIEVAEVPTVPEIEVPAEVVPEIEVPAEVPAIVSREEKKKEIEDLIEVLQPIADDGNSEAEELISTLKDVLESESYKNGGSIFSKYQKDKGKRVRLIEMKDPYPVPKDTMGTIDHIDDAGQIHVKWDNGSSLALIPNLDEYEIMAYGGQLKGGKSDNLTLSQIAKRHNVDLSVIERQYALGMEIESEHTNDKNIQAEIVKDHLTEFPNYYTELIKMETYLDRQKEYAEEGILIDNEDGFYIDLDDSIDHEMFFVMLMMDGIKYVEIPTNNSKRRIEFNTERDFDRALAGINKISNKAKKERSNFDYPKNLNQLKKILNKGFQLKIKYHRARPNEVGNIREVAVIQNNAIAYKDLSKPNSDLIWFYYPKANEIDFQENGFTVYFTNEPTKKMITYEYYFPENETPTPNPTPPMPTSKKYYIFKISKNENGKVDINSLSQFVKFDNIDDLANYIEKTYGLSEVAIYDSPNYGEIKRENGSVIGWAFANSLEEIYSDNKLHFETMEFNSKAKSSKVAEIEDLIDVLQPIADEGNQEALELIETLQDVLDNELNYAKGGGVGEQIAKMGTTIITKEYVDKSQMLSSAYNMSDINYYMFNGKLKKPIEEVERDIAKAKKEIEVVNKRLPFTTWELKLKKGQNKFEFMGEIYEIYSEKKPMESYGWKNRNWEKNIYGIRKITNNTEKDYFTQNPYYEKKELLISMLNWRFKSSIYVQEITFPLPDLDNEFKMGGESDKYKNAYDYKKGQIIKKEIEFVDINKDIEKSTDIEYLKELEKYVDMDIDNIGKDSDVIKKMKAKMRNLSVEEMEKQQKEGFLNLKKKIQNRISELRG
jgi:hypothetical protein